MDIERTVYGTAEKAHDLEVHVSLLKAGEYEFVDIREFVVSLEQYGRGLTLPVETAVEVHAFLDGLFAHLGDLAEVSG